MSTKHPTLKKWTTNFMNFDSQLTVSEKGTIRRIPIVGEIFNHPDYTDGETIHTSYITNAEISDQKIKVTTISGSNYYLDQPCHFFVEFVNVIKENDEKEHNDTVYQKINFDTLENTLYTIRWFFKMSQE